MSRNRNGFKKASRVILYEWILLNIKEINFINALDQDLFVRNNWKISNPPQLSMRTKQTPQVGLSFQFAISPSIYNPADGVLRWPLSNNEVLSSHEEALNK